MRPSSSGSLEGFGFKKWYFQTEQGSNPERRASEEDAQSTLPTPHGLGNNFTRCNSEWLGKWKERAQKSEQRSFSITNCMLFHLYPHCLPAYVCENLCLERYFVLGFTAPFVRIRHGLPCFILCVNFPAAASKFATALANGILPGLPASLWQINDMKTHMRNWIFLIAALIIQKPIKVTATPLGTIN